MATLIKQHPLDNWGNLCERYAVLYVETCTYTGDVLQKQFSFNDKCSWTKQQAMRIANLLKQYNYKAITLEKC